MKNFNEKSKEASEILEDFFAAENVSDRVKYSILKIFSKFRKSHFLHIYSEQDLAQDIIYFYYVSKKETKNRDDIKDRELYILKSIKTGCIHISKAYNKKELPLSYFSEEDASEKVSLKSDELKTPEAIMINREKSAELNESIQSRFQKELSMLSKLSIVHRLAAKKMPGLHRRSIIDSDLSDLTKRLRVCVSISEEVRVFRNKLKREYKKIFEVLKK